MARRHFIGGLDIGTTKIVSVIAEISPSGYAMVKGLGECPTLGIRKGLVTDIVSFSKVIDQAVRLSEKMANVKVRSFFVTASAFRQLADQYHMIDEKLAESMQRVGLELVKMVPSVLASAEAVLTDTDKNIGTVLVDMGGTITEVAVFDQGLPIYISSLPVGCEHITSDLAVCLRTSISEGERIKRLLGMQTLEQKKDLEVSSVGGHEQRKVPVNAAMDIIHSRVQEIFELIHKELTQKYRLESLPGGLVLTGGGSLLKDIVNYANSQMNFFKVELGSPSKVGVSKEEWLNPSYASSLGLVMYGAKNNSRRLERLSGWRDVLNKFI
ncbi:cell division protein FtsA [Desulforamulus reducens MI-1]|uniref:Cell division protein FtsA n=1 Tax=Desulforamulus reducens (strain ATCC BAA-1160 / DSM 100696 / MI-1) TaxID=349161 RepID=A4J2B9_DESRM|nr:cell division protein FtsA [Desulforamulus reducens MI-1]